MPNRKSDLSPAVRAAQQQLMGLRHRRTQGQLTTDSQISARSRVHPIQHLDALPAHLGWESATVTRLMRKVPQSAPPPLEQSVSDIQIKPAQETLRIHPELAAGLLQNKQVACGRIWFLLRLLDDKGQGWVSMAAARRMLTHPDRPHRVCGWRQLRNLLNRGDGLLWRRQDDRIWLTSQAKVCLALGIDRLNLPAVSLPVARLTASIGQVRAHLYATFHSGRADGNRPAAPIARATIESVTAVSPRIQRLYEKTARVTHQRHFSIGCAAGAEAMEEAAWQYGPAVFSLTDHGGHRGKAGRRYIAWQMPNSYQGPHRSHKSGQRKRINRQLADLLQNGIAGNGQSPMIQYSISSCVARQRYFGNGRLAARVVRHTPSAPVYWRDQSGGCAVGIWYRLG